MAKIYALYKGDEYITIDTDRGSVNHLITD